MLHKVLKKSDDIQIEEIIEKGEKAMAEVPAEFDSIFQNKIKRC